MRKRKVKLLNNKYIICTMWNKMKLATLMKNCIKEREKMALLNCMSSMSRSLVASPKSGPDYSVFIMK
jgi:hypothetical protein